MKAKRICVLGLSLLLLAGAGQPRLLVIDGDTLRLGAERLRIENLDAPDIGSHARCALENRRGTAARAYAQRLVGQASRFEVLPAGRRDRYGRLVARVRLDGQDFGEAMIRAGHGRPWRGRSSDWCR
jgi:micrococcal nuclease